MHPRDFVFFFLHYHLYTWNRTVKLLPRTEFVRMNFSPNFTKIMTERRGRDATTLGTCGLAISSSSNSPRWKISRGTRNGRVTYRTHENNERWSLSKLTGLILEGKRYALAGRAAQKSHQQQPPGQLGRSPQHRLKAANRRIRLIAELYHAVFSSVRYN